MSIILVEVPWAFCRSLLREIVVIYVDCNAFKYMCVHVLFGEGGVVIIQSVKEGRVLLYK